MKRSRMLLEGLVVLLTIAGFAFADGVIVNGISPRSLGRGGTDIAHADTVGMLLDNPAGAVNFDGNVQYEFGVNMLFTDMSYADPLRHGTTSEYTPLPEVGFIKKSADGNWAYGLGVFAPAGFLERYRMEGPAAFPGQREYFSLGTLGKVLPALAYRVNDELSIGATLGLAISHDELEGPYTLQGSGMPTMLDLQATGAALCWSLGMQYKVTEATTLGLTYQSESRFELHGPTRVEPFGMGTYSYNSKVNMTWPRSMGLGVRHELCPHRIVSVDVIYTNWSSAFDEIGISLTNPANPIPVVEEQLPLHWRDTVSTRLGYERILDNGHIVRCGYVYHRNPIPAGTITPFIQSTLEHALSLGYGCKWNKWDLDFGYMYSFSPDLQVGTSQLAGHEYDNSTHRAQVHCGAFSFIRRY